jgi:hypothetical protein
MQAAHGRRQGSHSTNSRLRRASFRLHVEARRYRVNVKFMITLVQYIVSREHREKSFWYLTRVRASPTRSSRTRINHHRQGIKSRTAPEMGRWRWGRWYRCAAPEAKAKLELQRAKNGRAGSRRRSAKAPGEVARVCREVCTALSVVVQELMQRKRDASLRRGRGRRRPEGRETSAGGGVRAGADRGRGVLAFATSRRRTGRTGSRSPGPARGGAPRCRRRRTRPARAARRGRCRRSPTC